MGHGLHVSRTVMASANILHLVVMIDFPTPLGESKVIFGPDLMLLLHPQRDSKPKTCYLAVVRLGYQGYWPRLPTTLPYLTLVRLTDRKVLVYLGRLHQTLCYLYMTTIR